MILTRPLFCLAVATAMFCSFATQASAQDPATILACEQFNAAVAEKEGAFVVSGTTIEEETIDIRPDFSEITFRVLTSGTPQLSIPSGTLTREGRDFEANDVVGLIGRLDDGVVADFFATPGLTLVDGNVELDEGILPTLSLRPDPSFGNAFGFCFSTLDPMLGAEVDQEVSFFDGDTLIGQSNRANPSFFAQPGETITRIELASGSFSDIQVAFCNDTPDPELTNQECLASIAAEVGALADAATDSKDAYALNVACYALNFAAKDKFYAEDGNRLSRRGGNVFTGAAYAISYLEHTGVEGTEDIVDRILEKLEAIVDDEIDYAIENGGKPEFIDRAEDFAELAEWIDEDLDNPVVAAIAYKLAWANAYFSTY